MKRVVIVEDNEVVAKYLRYVLEQAGYVVSVTESGDEAMTLARRPETLAILVDVSLRSTQYEGRRIDATANGSFMSLEPTGFIRKPIVDPRELLSLIETLSAQSDL